MSAVLTYTVDHGVATMTMCRPDARNALNQQLRDALREGFARFTADADAKVLVLAGEGPTFCAGADLKEMAETGLQVPPPDFVPTIHEFPDCDKPVIAAVQGAALGGGFCLALWCDLIVADDGATFGVTEARWGRGAPWALPLVAIVGPRAATQLLATATPVAADRAFSMGLVNEVVPAGSHLAAAQAMAAQIASMAPLSVQAGVRMVRRLAASGFAGLTNEVAQMWAPVYSSEDAQEGPRAFAEKREPKWSGV
ncbi:MAG: hypothetical protein RL745_1055 [Actinomycetota bacterium]